MPARKVIGGIAAATIAITGVSATVAYGTKPEPRAKNIILLIGDGMGVTHVDAARLRFYGADGRLHMESMPQFGQVSTYAVQQGSNEPEYVTDSASSATAWASGVKTYNNAIGKDTFGNVVPTIMEQAKQAGMRTGNVSTAEITDATPAGMFAHVSRRACQGPDYSESTCQEPGHGRDKPVAEQIAENNVADVIFGGGLARFEPDDEARMKANGYTVLGSFGDAALQTQTAASQKVATRTDMQNVTGKNRRVIGLFNRGNLTVEQAKQANPAGAQAQEPKLAEMTSKAINLLRNSEDATKAGFLLQVEGALIDKRSHANDAAQTLEEMKAFDDAVKVALDFAKKDKNTLVITTADHECAGFNIIGKGSFTNAEAATPPGNVDSGNTANNSTPSRAAAQTKDATRSSGIVNAPGSADVRNFGPATFRTADDPANVKDGTVEASLWLSYLSGNHTGADVNIYAYGPGSKQFDDQIDNTDIYDFMVKALGGLPDRTRR